MKYIKERMKLELGDITLGRMPICESIYGTVFIQDNKKKH